MSSIIDVALQQLEYLKSEYPRLTDQISNIQKSIIENDDGIFTTAKKGLLELKEKNKILPNIPTWENLFPSSENPSNAINEYSANSEDEEEHKSGHINKQALHAPPNDTHRLNRAIEKHVIEKHLENNDYHKEDYKLTESESFKEWCKQKKLNPESDQAKEFQKSEQFREIVDKKYIEKNPSLKQEIEKEKLKTYENPKDDPVLKEMEKIIQEKRESIPTQTAQEITKREKEISSHEDRLANTFRRSFPEKTEAYARQNNDSNDNSQINRLINKIRSSYTQSIQNNIANVVSPSSFPSTGQRFSPNFGGHVRQGAKRLGKNIGGIGKNLFKQGAMQGARTALTALAAATSETWGTIALIIAAIIIVIILIILLAVILGSLGDGQNQLSIVKTLTSPQSGKIANPPTAETATFTINVSYSGTAQSGIVVDPIPDNAEFVSATENPTLKDENGNIVTDSTLVRRVEWPISVGGETVSSGENATCGEKSTPPAGNEVGMSCSGNRGSSQKSTDGYYSVTSFGCSPDGSDPPDADNCAPGCGTASIPECKGLTNKTRGECETKLKWFAADALRFGCNTKLKVTNPLTGNGVIVRAIDYGPACWAEEKRGRSIIDLSYSAAKALNATTNVTVEEVPEDTPLGPINTCGNASVQTSATSSGTQTTGSTSNFVFDEAKFKSYGFPAPNGGISLSGPILEKWKAKMPYAIKAAQITGVDVGIIGMWGWIESNFYNYMNVCGGTNQTNQNNYCNYDSILYQIGAFGNHPESTINYVKEAFDVMHSGETVQQVGQKILNDSKNKDLCSKNDCPITNPTSFPNLTIDEIINGAKSGNQEKRILLYQLYKDDAIGTYLTAKHFKDIGLNSGLAAKMKEWDSTYYAPQKIINHIKAIYDAGVSGNASENTSLIGTSNFSFQIVLKPKSTTKDTYIVNQAFVEGITSGGSSTGSTCSDGRTITLDPGHSPYGCTFKIKGDKTEVADSNEMKVNFEVATKLKAKLETMGYNIIMTKNNLNDCVGNKERADIASDNNSLLFFRIHENSGSSIGYFMMNPDSTSPYSKLPTQESMTKGDQAANAIISALDAAYNSGNLGNKTKIANGLMKESDYAGNAGKDETCHYISGQENTKCCPNLLTGSCYSKVPTTLIEMEGYKNSWLRDSANQEKMASALATGIDNYAKTQGATSCTNQQTPTPTTTPTITSNIRF